MERSRRSVDVYLRRLPEPDRAAMVAIDEVLVAIDEVLVDAMSGASRRPWVGTFWDGTHQEIVGYGDLLQDRPDGGQVDWFTIGRARQRRNLSLCVNAVELEP